jgi:hypothetical protein
VIVAFVTIVAMVLRRLVFLVVVLVIVLGGGRWGSLCDADQAETF